MNNKILIGSIIAVVIIVLSSFSSVVGKVSLDEELVEFDVELSGLGKKHTVSLTQQEADEVELFFDEIQSKLEDVESREEAEEIFKDAVVELDKYGLLGGLSVKQAHRLVTFPYQRFQNNKFLQRIVNADKLDDNENFYCSIFGDITEARFYRIPFFLLLYPLTKIIPLKLFSSISIGYYTWYVVGPNEPHPSEGQVWTNGTNGNIQWDGLLRGDIGERELFNSGFMSRIFFFGVKGFYGIQLTLNGTTVFFGFARQVKIKDYW